MKKLILGLFFTLCAFQVNAATYNLYSDDSGTLVAGTNDIPTGTRVFSGVSVQNTSTSGSAGSVSWWLDVDPSVTSLVINGSSPNPYLKLSGVAIYNNDDLATSLFSVTPATLSETLVLTADLVSGVLYKIIVDYKFTVSSNTVAGGTVDINVSSVPVPAAVWLFGSALMGLVGISRRKTGSALSA